MRAPTTATEAGAPTIAVVKQTFKGGPDIGLSKVAMPMTQMRTPTGDMISEHWCIMTGRESAPFYKAGESGVCVWNTQGRVGEILIGGGGNAEGGLFDVSYVTPIEWLLEDILS